MKTQTLLLLAAMVLASGCSSGRGGGGSGSSGPVTDPALQPLRPGYEPSPCGTLYGYPVQCVPTQRKAIDAAMAGSGGSSAQFGFGPAGSYAPTESKTVHGAAPEPLFTSWSAMPALVWNSGGPASFKFDAMRMTLYSSDTWAGSTSRMQEDWVNHSQWTFGRLYDPDRKLAHLPTTVVRNPQVFELNPTVAFTTGTASFLTLDAIGEPGIDVGKKASRGQQNWFVSAPKTGDIALAANPYVQGWNYQSFGVWDNNAKEHIVPSSFGAGTPGSAVPTVGSATFTGKLSGLYLSPAGQGSIATADISVNANFSARSLGFASSRTMTTRDLQTATDASHLNLRGTLTYSPASNTFSGTLTNAGGTMSGTSTGRYYGPNAQELGGIFNLKSPKTVETFSGAYGAKR